MQWYIFDTWIVLVAALVAVSACLSGVFLMLRKMSMMGDAISHAVLPGLVIAFLWTGSHSSVVMLIGAAITGLLTAVFVQWINTFAKVDKGAAMGVVFTSLFALGIILIVQVAEHTHIDPACVLYGAIEMIPLETINVEIFSYKLEVPSSIFMLSAVALFNIALVAIFYKEYKICAFDPAMAQTQGINVKFFHYLLMSQVAITTVAAFEAVGSIIVLAMMIVPAATAYLLTKRLSLMIAISIVIGILSSLLGHIFALTLPLLIGFESASTSGMIALACGLFFLLAWLFTKRKRAFKERRKKL